MPSALRKAKEVLAVAEASASAARAMEALLVAGMLVETSEARAPSVARETSPLKARANLCQVAGRVLVALLAQVSGARLAVRGVSQDKGKEVLVDVGDREVSQDKFRVKAAPVVVEVPGDRRQVADEEAAAAALAVVAAPVVAEAPEDVGVLACRARGVRRVGLKDRLDSGDRAESERRVESEGREELVDWLESADSLDSGDRVESERRVELVDRVESADRLDSGGRVESERRVES